MADNAIPAAMDNAVLATALTTLADAIANLNNANVAAAPPPPAAHTVILDPFASNAPFDLSTRTGSSAFTTASTALEDPWGGTVKNFPAFIVSLHIRVGEVHWNSAAPTGILDIGGHNLLTDYHSVTDTAVEAAHVARADPRAIQNSRVMYKCVKSSITGDLCATIFDQADNLPTTEDGPTLFKKLTAFTMVASLHFLNLILRYTSFISRPSIPSLIITSSFLPLASELSSRLNVFFIRLRHTLASNSLNSGRSGFATKLMISKLALLPFAKIL
jgi:hypothetical protein